MTFHLLKTLVDQGFEFKAANPKIMAIELAQRLDKVFILCLLFGTILLTFIRIGLFCSFQALKAMAWL